MEEDEEMLHWSSDGEQPQRSSAQSSAKEARGLVTPEQGSSDQVQQHSSPPLAPPSFPSNGSAAAFALPTRSVPLPRPRPLLQPRTGPSSYSQPPQREPDLFDLDSASSPAPPPPPPSAPAAQPQVKKKFTPLAPVKRPPAPPSAAPKLKPAPSKAPAPKQPPHPVDEGFHQSPEPAPEPAPEPEPESSVEDLVKRESKKRKVEWCQPLEVGGVEQEQEQDRRAASSPAPGPVTAELEQPVGSSSGKKAEIKKKGKGKKRKALSAEFVDEGDDDSFPSAAISQPYMEQQQVAQKSKGKGRKKRKAPVDEQQEGKEDDSITSAPSPSGPSRPRSQPQSQSTSQLSTSVPAVSARFPTRLALLTAVSFAYHSLGFTSTILRYSDPNKSTQKLRLGCPLYLPATNPNRCLATLDATLDETTGEWVVQKVQGSHSHPALSVEERGEWKRPIQRNRKPKDGGGGAAAGRSKARGGKRVKTDEQDDEEGGDEPQIRSQPAPMAIPSFPRVPSLSPGPPLPLAPPALPPAPPPQFDAFRPSYHSQEHHSTSLSLHSLDDPLAQLLGTSVTSVRLELGSAEVVEQSVQAFQLAGRGGDDDDEQGGQFDGLPPPPPPFDQEQLHQQALLPRAPQLDADATDTEPSQAEMDAFFGFKAPPPPPAASLAPPPAASLAISPRVPSPARSSAVSQGQSQRLATIEELEEELEEGVGNVDGEDVEVKQEEVHEEKAAPYQLQAIDSSLEGEEKRLAIIGSLEKLAVSVLQQLVEALVPCSPPQQGEGSKKKPATKPKLQPIVIVLAKRGGTEPTEQLSSALKTRRLIFPRVSGGKAGSPLRLGGRELAAFLKVVEAILEGLKSRQVSTKRDIYYRAVSIFLKQSVVDSIVDDIAATLQVRRGHLNVVAASKGLFAGAIKVHTSDGVVLEGGSQGALIPAEQMIDRIEVVGNVKWALIVEKEAVFQSLCSPDFLSHTQLPPGILLTGKGYPDLSTRELVHRLASSYASIPHLCLVDSDPHGLEILSTYKYGSASLAFDRANLAVDKVEWLGVKGSEWDSIGVERSELLALSNADRKKALKMLKREWLPEEWRRELEYMLHLQRKAEIQVLSSAAPSSQSQRSSGSSSHLVDYVVSRLLAVIS